LETWMQNLYRVYRALFYNFSDYHEHMDSV
jgi:hypothetical protein